MWGPERIFDPRTAKFRVRLRMPVTVVAGPPVDLSKWDGATPSREVLTEMTDAIMLRLRDMLAEIRGGTPPPLFTPAVKRVGSAGGEERAREPRSPGRAGSAAGRGDVQ
jgi:hypothetical protein